MNPPNANVVHEDDLTRRIFDVTVDVRQSVAAFGDVLTVLRRRPGVSDLVATATAALDGLRHDLSELAALCSQLGGLPDLTVTGARWLGAAEATVRMLEAQARAFDNEVGRLARAA